MDNYSNYQALGEYDNIPTEDEEEMDMSKYNKEINLEIMEGIKV